MRSLLNCSEASRGSYSGAKQTFGELECSNDVSIRGQSAHEGRQVVDSDHGHSRVPLADLDLNSRFRERGVDRGVDGDRVVRVGSAAKRIIRVNCQSRFNSMTPGET
jgi:hypothetical protein